MLSQYLFLVLAIVCEVIGTTAMAASQQFTKLVPVLILVVSYGFAFYFLSITLKTLPVGIAYAMWSGLGIVLISLVGYVAMGQKLDFAAVVGMSMIIGGVVVIQLFSKSAGH